MRIFSSGLTSMPCGCDISDAHVFEEGKELAGVLGVDTDLGIVWECRQDESEKAKAELAKLNARPGYPVINGVYLSEANGDLKVFTRRGAFTVKCCFHDAKDGMPLKCMGLSTKAMEVLKNTFAVGKIDGPVFDGRKLDESLIGACAIDLVVEGEGYVIHHLSRLGAMVNAIVERDLVIGLRSGPLEVRRVGPRRRLEMRVMCAPGKSADALQLAQWVDGHA